jgi:hypothetical protein
MESISLFTSNSLLSTTQSTGTILEEKTAVQPKTVSYPNQDT